MSLQDAARAIRAPGQILIGVTDPTADLPHGDGTGLGLVRDAVLRRIARGQKHLEAWEKGGRRINSVLEDAEYVLAVGLRGMDDDAIEAILPNTFDGAGASRRGIREPGAVLPGSWANDRATNVMFSADNDAHPSVLLYNAWPVFADRLEIPFGSEVEIVWRVVWVGSEDSSGRVVEVQLRRDLTAP